MWRLLQTSGGFGGAQTVQWNERKRSTHEILPGAFGIVSGVAGIRAFPLLPPPLPGAGQFDVELLVTSSDPPEQMAAVAGQLVGKAFQSGKFLFADTDLKIDLPRRRSSSTARRWPTWGSTWPPSGATWPSCSRAAT